LNDILCQIEKACRYAERFGRVVVVETDYHCSISFQDSFLNYFISLQPDVLIHPSRSPNAFEDLRVFPHFVQGHVNTYTSRFDTALRNFVDEHTLEPLSFDFTRDYSEPLLIHHACGGGEESIAALARMRLHEHLVDLLSSRLDLIRLPYSAIHIRNSDMRTDYERPVERLKGMIRGPLFVATDDRNALDFCKSVFGASRVHSFAALPSCTELPVHKIYDRSCAYRRNTDAILDLIMLALSTQYYFFSVSNGAASRFAHYSGFSRLAKNLQDSEPILDRLIGKRFDRWRRSDGVTLTRPSKIWRKLSLSRFLHSAPSNPV